MLKVHKQKFESYKWIEFEDYKFCKTGMHIIVYHDNQNYFFPKDRTFLMNESRDVVINRVNLRGDRLSYRFKFRNFGIRDACLRFINQALKDDMNARKIRLQNQLSRAL